MTRFHLSVGTAAALALTIAAVFCHPASAKEAAGPQLLLSRLRVAFVPGGTERIQVTATDESGQRLPFSVLCDNEAVATVTATDSTVTVTGRNYGTANVTVICGTARKTFPVQVYDPMVLETDELLIKFVDAFAWRWNTAGYRNHGAFIHPGATDGFRPLGSVAYSGFELEPGQAWAVVVKAKPGSDALKPPVDYACVWSTKETGVAGGSGTASSPGSLWDPTPPPGYHALGTVAQQGYDKPSLNDVYCVRADLTVSGEWGTAYVTWGGSDYQDWEASPILSPRARPHDLCYLPTGAFAAHRKGADPTNIPHNVLKVKLPVLAEAPSQDIIPRLVGYDTPPDYTDPLLAKEVLVPWCMVDDPTLPTPRDRIRVSPFYRLERQVCFECNKHVVNTQSVLLPYEATWEKGITKSESETASEKTGVEVSVEMGISCQFKAIGGDMSVGVTVSKELGYERTSGIEEFSSETVKVPFYAPPEKAVALWVGHNRFVLKRHAGTGLEEVKSWSVRTKTYVNDEYPDE